MSNNNSKYILPVCAIVASFFGVSIIRYSLGLYLEALGKQAELFPRSVQFVWRVHDYRWLILILGTAGFIALCRRTKTEAESNLVSGLYMLAWFALCFLVQFCLVYGLNQR